MNTKHLEEDKAMSKEIAKEFGEGYLPPLPTIEIEKPLAFEGDKVSFFNHRTPSQPQTTGVVWQTKTFWLNDTEYQHLYEVQPDGKNYDIVVKCVELINSK